MALYVIIGKECWGWHLGAELPLNASQLEKVDIVQADGDELNYIHRNIAFIPSAPNNRVVKWYGDHAKFIANNLKFTR